MGFFDFLKQPDINQGVEQYKTTSGAILLDVRTPEEYAEGHIPGGQNLPLQNIDKAADIIDNKENKKKIIIKPIMSKNLIIIALIIPNAYIRHIFSCT